ncbi:MAG: hypothetical protein AAB911_01835 [Patescibacteria group bacterium]
MRIGYRNIIAAAVLIFISIYFHLSANNIADPDGFYHIAHAKIYRDQGLLSADFPWVQYSAINQLKADIWYGFHVFLIPFTYFNDLTIGIKFAGIFLTSLVLILFFLIIKKLQVQYPLFWTILLFFSVPDVHWRFLMVRPHILTFILGLFLLYYLAKNNRWGILFSALAISFFHLALFWIVFLIVGAVLISQTIIKSKIKFIPIVYAVVGAIMGWLARPNPIGAIKLAYIQVVQLMVEKLNGIPFQFGSELKPGSHWSVLITEFLPIAILLILAIWAWLKNKHTLKSESILLWSSLILAMIFGGIFVFIARRSIDLFVGFGLIFAALSWSLFGSKIRHSNILLTVFFAVLAANTLYFANIYKKQAISSNTFKESSLWLKENSKSGDIVFNVHWDNFPMLFFWNQKNYYINGMDPIFEYAFDKQLYWKHYYLDIDGLAIKNNIGYTCSNIRSECSDNNMVEVYDALKNNFKAKYIFVEPSRNPKLNRYLEFDKRFKNVFSNQSKESIFEVL